MLKQITLTNFKKHESLSIDFAPGLNAIKGGNEAGKSTTLAAVAYALFGTKALPYSLEDTVTYGKPAGTLKVVLDFEVAGTQYTITRSKSSAELVYVGGTVTGQTETSNFIGKLLGTDAQAAPKLILANQNDIRGSLTAGPKATTELIEKLAQFDQLDNLIELIQEKLTTGSTAAAEAALATAQAQLDEVPDLQVPDTAALTRAEAEANDGVLAAQSEVGLQQVRVREQTALLNAILKANNDVVRCMDAVVAAQKRLGDAEGDLKQAAALPSPVDEKALAAAKAKVKALETDLDGADAFNAVQKHLGLEPVYPESVTALEAEVDQLRGDVADATNRKGQASAAIARDTALMVAGSCSLCGKDVSDVPEVAEKNAALQRSVDAHKKVLADLTKEIAKKNDSITALLKLKTDARGALAAAGKAGVVVVKDTVPPVLKWGGRTDFDKVEADLLKARKKLKELEQAQREYDNAVQAHNAAQKAVARAQQELADAEAALGGRTQAPVDGIREDISEAEAAVEVARAKLDEWRTRLEVARSARREAVAAWESHLKIKAMLDDQVTQRRKELKTLTFNNLLLKAVRAARPVIADKLWGLVLGAVSRYFSEMRGQRSLVTKTSDGFVVDGHAAAGLSGSTLDVLGLAIRVALVRTFVPHASLLVLDEPAAGCDADRTQALLGFLSSSGFAQTVVVSHEEATEAVADHLIEL